MKREKELSKGMSSELRIEEKNERERRHKQKSS